MSANPTPTRRLGLVRDLTLRLAGRVLVVGLLCWLHPPSWAQTVPQAVSIRVHADQPDGSFPPVWSFFGYDEPNYSYAPNGKKLLGELSALSPSPVYVRVHNLLTS
jgi:xylan 1,4-beta-xylosidase